MKNFTSCFKEKKFLEFFYKRIRLNKSGRYEIEFPFISLCGRERNYIRCDDVPIVYTHIIEKGTDILTYGYAGDLMTFPFAPQKIYMAPNTGRVYHPTEEKYGSIALVRSKLAIELSKNFQFKEESPAPTQFIWRGVTYDLDQNWFEEAQKKHKIIIKST